jgi:hypothetical protein
VCWSWRRVELEGYGPGVAHSYLLAKQAKT